MSNILQILRFGSRKSEQNKGTTMPAASFQTSFFGEKHQKRPRYIVLLSENVNKIDKQNFNRKSTISQDLT